MMPRLPSTRTVAPSGIRRVASGHTTAGRLKSRYMPIIKRIELPVDGELVIDSNSGLYIAMHLVFGRIEAISGKRSIQLSPVSAFSDDESSLKLLLKAMMCLNAPERAPRPQLCDRDRKCQ